MTQLKIQDKKTLALKILKIFEKQNPTPKCELYFETPYQLLVSVILSAQATDKSVNKCMTSLYQKGFDQNTVLTLGTSGLLKIIKSIGLSSTKSKNIYNATKILKDRFNDKIPDNREELESLPGVGCKTASVILAELYNQPVLAVDTHVYRVTTRLDLQTESSPQKAEKALLQIIPKRFLPRAHHWFILHGRYICKARNPLCSQCPLNNLCKW